MWRIFFYWSLQLENLKTFLLNVDEPSYGKNNQIEQNILKFVSKLMTTLLETNKNNKCWPLFCPSQQFNRVHFLQASRAQILKKAADYIQYMRKKNSAHLQDIDDLRRQNNLLEAQSKFAKVASFLNFLLIQYK